jgi:hypothetical protein
MSTDLHGDAGLDAEDYEWDVFVPDPDDAVAELQSTLEEEQFEPDEEGFDLDDSEFDWVAALNEEPDGRSDAEARVEAAFDRMADSVRRAFGDDSTPEAEPQPLTEEDEEPELLLVPDSEVGAADAAAWVAADIDVALETNASIEEPELNLLPDPDDPRDLDTGVVESEFAEDAEPAPPSREAIPGEFEPALLAVLAADLGGEPGVLSDGSALDETALDETALDETALDETALDETALDRSELDVSEFEAGQAEPRSPATDSEDAGWDVAGWNDARWDEPESDEAELDGPEPHGPELHEPELHEAELDEIDRATYAWWGDSDLGPENDIEPEAVLIGAEAELRTSPVEPAEADAWGDDAEPDDLTDPDFDLSSGADGAPASARTWAHSRVYTAIVVIACLFLVVIAALGIARIWHDRVHATGAGAPAATTETSTAKTPTTTTPTTAAGTNVALILTATDDANAATTTALAGLASLPGFPTNVVSVINPYVASLRLYQTFLSGASVPAASRPAAATALAEVGSDVTYFSSVDGMAASQLGAYLSQFHADVAQLQGTMSTLEQSLRSNATP